MQLLHRPATAAFRAIALVVALVAIPPEIANAHALVSGGLTALPVLHGLGPDLVVNGSFEATPSSPPSGWSGDAAWALDSSVTRSGAFSYRLSNAPGVAFTQVARQAIALPRGTYRLSGWIRTVGLGDNDARYGVRLNLDYTRPGEPLQRGTTVLVRGTSEWTYYERRDIVVPDDRDASLKLEAYGEPDGTAWFDDIKVERQIPPPLDVFLLYPNFRGMLFDEGPSTISVDVTVHSPGNDVARFSVRATLEEESSGLRVASEDYAATAHFVAALEGGAMSPGVAHLLRVSLVDRSSGAVIYSYPAYRVSRVLAGVRATMNVAFDEKNRLLVHGVPRFMLGVYDSGMGYGTTDAYWENLLWSPTGDRRLDGLPINFYLNYWYGGASAASMHSLMANLARRGVMYLQTGNCFSTGPAGSQFAINASDAYVQDVGANAQLGGYYTIDECVSAMVPGAFAQYERLRTLDPDSVTFAALLGNPPDVVLWRDTADLLSTDPYPLYAAEPSGGYRHNDVARWTAQTREAVKDARPFATVLQFFKFTSQGRWPTRQEMRNHAYMAIVEGARGLWWWSLGENALKAVCSGWCDEKTARLNDLKAVVSEIAALEPVLLADDAPSSLVATSTPAIRMRVKLTGGTAWLFAYNDAAAPTSATFTWSTAPGRITVNAENRTIAAAGNGFTDSFAPYQAHVYAVPLVSVRIAADRMPPQAPGTTIRFTADVTGGGASPELQWWLHDGKSWSVAQGWSTTRTFTWTPSVANPAPSIGVWVRKAPTRLEPDAIDSMAFPVIRPVVTLTALTADRSAPQPPGTTTTFTAHATGGLAPLEFRWWLYDGTAWNLARDWSTSNSLSWRPSVVNPTAAVGVWVRSAGATGDPDVTRGLSFPILTAPVTLGALVSDRASPQPPGTVITFTAPASGGLAPLEFRWWLFDGVSWHVAREWSTSNTFTWAPSAANPNAAVGVWVRGSGTTAGADVTRGLAFPIVRPALTLSALTSSMASPQAPGTPITFTASTSGGTAPLEYRWWLFNGATWSIAREWSTASTFTWTPAAANPKAAVGVWVRSAGSAAEFEVTRSLVFPIVSAP